MKKRWICLFVENEIGVLARISGLFSAKSYNLDSLTVGITEDSMATNTCALQNTMNNNTRDIIDSQNAGTRAILDYLCQDKISNLQNENQALRLAASQSNQNAVLMAAMDANKAEILRRTGAECPTAAYIVQPPQPVSFNTNCNGQATFGNNCGCNSGCGNGCGNCGF